MITTEAAFARYERLRPILPQASFPETSRTGRTLEDTMGDYDAYILDAFGVLNRGEAPIPGAVERIAQLRAAGKRLIVLTNAASYTRSGVLAKYHRLGFDFTLDEVVSSRDVAFAHLPEVQGVWAAITADGDDLSDAPAGHYIADLHTQPELLISAAAFLFLSTARWSDADNARLERALQFQMRPVIVANPDLVAPREDGLSLEPGWYAQTLAASTGATMPMFGKPFGNAFDEALRRLPGISPHRIAMVGDTLHTDVLGGAAAGLGTILIQEHGLFRGLSPAPFIEASGLQPDWLVQST
ncbi:HAD-IIA family hydrolase [Salipiger bermudensis]|uniref:HAD-IIA family hydrolase n=1 Tax=Salipiger bermudensis TaxID=344736 RepID=UPI001CD35C55|nr:HAD family hydrolase [Salipiger bermudensis]MCA0962072.1 HAD hydrolase-like protein [Salipiger bermudensis]